MRINMPHQLGRCWLDLAGFVQIDDIPAFFTYGTFTQMDTRILGVINERSQAQQAFEALAMLIVLRMWLPALAHNRIKIRVRGDNLGALSLVAKMQPKSKALLVIARELSLTISDCSYAPDFVEHVPGICNGIADELSRCAAVGSEFQLPVMLSNATFQAPPARNENWWRARPAEANSA